MSVPGAPAGEQVIAGRYALRDVIGRGGMGTVWRAEDRLIGRRVAVKELRLPSEVPPPQHEAITQRVLREARSAGRLSHPSTVTIHDVVWENHTVYIVMELLDAPTLTEAVRRWGPMPAPRAAETASQVLGALETAHAAGIVHRDVKPSNIVLLADGRAKLTDFGIALVQDDPHLTETGVIVGSPAFMAPEQVAGEKVTSATDLWQLGVMLYFAVEGRSPFEREDHQATLHAVTGFNPPTPQCGQPLAWIIMQLLAKNPADRPAGAHLRGLLERASRTPPAPPVDVNGGGTRRRDPATRAFVSDAKPSPARRLRPALKAGRAAVIALALLATGVVLDRTVFEDPAATVMTWGNNGDLALESSLSDGGCANGRMQAGQNFDHVDCDEPHDVQFWTYATSLPRSDQQGAGNLYRTAPEEESLRDYAASYCRLAFYPYVSKDPGRSKLDWAAIVPSRSQWVSDSRHYNRVYCALWREDGTKLRGSATGTAR